MELLKAVGSAIGTVIGWIVTTITALFDWEWTGISEWIIIFIVIGIITTLAIKIYKAKS